MLIWVKWILKACWEYEGLKPASELIPCVFNPPDNFLVIMIIMHKWYSMQKTAGWLTLVKDWLTLKPNHTLWLSTFMIRYMFFQFFLGSTYVCARHVYFKTFWPLSPFQGTKSYVLQSNKIGNFRFEDMTSFIDKPSLKIRLHYLQKWVSFLPRFKFIFSFWCLIFLCV